MCDKLTLTFRKDAHAAHVCTDAAPCMHVDCNIPVIALRRTQWLEHRSPRYARVSNVTYAVPGHAGVVQVRDASERWRVCHGPRVIAGESRVRAVEFTLTDIRDCDPNDFEFSFWTPRGHILVSAQLTDASGAVVNMTPPAAIGIKHYLWPRVPIIRGYCSGLTPGPENDQSYGWVHSDPRSSARIIGDVEREIWARDDARDAAECDLVDCDIDFTCLTREDVAQLVRC